MNLREHVILGCTVRPCRCGAADGLGNRLRWYEVTPQPGGRALLDQFSDHFRTLAEARAILSACAMCGCNLPPERDVTQPRVCEACSGLTCDSCGGTNLVVFYSYGLYGCNDCDRD